MTLAHIKSQTLRRTLLCVCVPLLPVIIIVIAAVAALGAFWEELKYQSSQGVFGVWDSVKSCWRGDQA